MDMPEQTSAEAPRIVVGIDGSQGSKTALAWAMAEARLAGTTVEAVTAWQDPIRTGYGFAYGWSAASMDDGGMRIAAEKTLDATITEVSGMQDNPVEVSVRVVQGHPAEVLLASAATARLLVVGTRGHSAFAGMLLGSVSQHCTQHAPCPVVVVPPASDQAAPNPSSLDDASSRS
jgi:nucleotide-binding universal stress UspA family protein